MTTLRPNPDGLLNFGEAVTLIDQLLAEQGTLTAVEEFARAHSSGAASGHYRQLLPLTPPAHGEQYAFEVDVDKCSGCKACVTACHSLNGLDEEESWREVGQLVNDDWRHPVQQNITTACHHCVDPGCLNGCPVLAYEKDSITGIVRHLDDQCIGCSYCILMCPYDAPKYSKKRGIVRKCDMCSQRLAEDEAPACAQACPNEAIRITVVLKSEMEAEFRQRESRFLPTAPDPAITLPATRYVTKSPAQPGLRPASAPRLQPAEWPLIWMLLLTQFGVGSILMSFLFPPRVGRSLWEMGLVGTFLGIGASVFHLGQPAKAWRSFLGWRRSWLSREIICFATFPALALLNVPGIAPLTALAGISAVFCSAMLYHKTGRAFWAARLTIPKFFFTALVLALAAAWFINGTTSAGILFTVALLLKLAGESRFLRRAADPISEQSWASEGGEIRWALARTAAVTLTEFGLVTRYRFFLGALAAILALANGLVAVPEVFRAMAFLSAMAGEVLERYLFFRAVVTPRMPGGA